MKTSCIIIGIVLIILGIFYLFLSYMPKGVGTIIIGMGLGLIFLGFFKLN